MQIIIDVNEKGQMKIQSALDPITTAKILLESAMWKLGQIKLEPAPLVKVAKVG